jgi:Condensation domain
LTERHPLSLAQREVLQDQRAWPGSPHLLVGGCGVLQGPATEAALRQALQDLVDEQPVLRFIPGLGGQRLLAHFDAPLVRVPAPDGLEPLDALQAVWHQWTQEAPPLGDEATVPPWRVGLMCFAPDRHGFLLWVHHSLLDGYSTAVLTQRWAELYSARAQGAAVSGPQDRRYLQHILDDQSYLDGPRYASDAAFWAQELPTAPAQLFPSHGNGLTDALVTTQWLPRTEYQQWAALSHVEGQTEFATLAAALAWHSAALLEREEIVIGVPMLNRHGRSERHCLGMFVGISPLRLVLSDAHTPRQLIALVGRQLRGAMRHAHFPGSSLARQLQLAQQGRDRLFDLVLSFERQDFSVTFGPAALTASRQLFNGKARFPLSLTLCDFGPGRELALTAEGSAKLFDARGLELLLRRLRWLAAKMHDAPDAPLRTLPLLPPAERDAVLDGLHRDVARMPEAPSFVARFSEQAALHPESTALVWDGGSLSYGALQQQVLACAKRLVAHGVQPGQCPWPCRAGPSRWWACWPSPGRVAPSCHWTSKPQTPASKPCWCNCKRPAGSARKRFKSD